MQLGDPVLLWLWCRPVAVAPIGPLAWKPPYVASVALKRTKDQKKEKETEPEPTADFNPFVGGENLSSPGHGGVPRPARIRLRVLWSGTEWCLGEEGMGHVPLGILTQT